MHAMPIPSGPIESGPIESGPIESGPTISGESWMPHSRGYHAVYREHEINHCPGCGRTHWLIGRVSVECAFCATALPLAEASMRSHNGPVVIQHKNRDLHDWAA
jgi:hypothetical protein